MKSIKFSTPLSIIAIFACLAETSGTVVLPFLKNDTIQLIYVWFLMVFPLILVILFFITLWKKHSVFYSPGEYRDDDAYIEVANLIDSKNIIDKELAHKKIKLTNDIIKKEIPNISTQNAIIGKLYEMETIIEDEKNAATQFQEYLKNIIPNKYYTGSEKFKNDIMNTIGKSISKENPTLLNKLSKYSYIELDNEKVKILGEGKKLIDNLFESFAFIKNK